MLQRGVLGFYGGIFSNRLIEIRGSSKNIQFFTTHKSFNSKKDETLHNKTSITKFTILLLHNLSNVFWANVTSTDYFVGPLK